MSCCPTGTPPGRRQRPWRALPRRDLLVQIAGWRLARATARGPPCQGPCCPPSHQTWWPDRLPGHHHAAVLRGDAVQLEQHVHGHYVLVGLRSALTFTFGFSVLSTTLISKGNLLPEVACHCTPTTGVATTPGAGPLVKLSRPDMPS